MTVSLPLTVLLVGCLVALPGLAEAQTIHRKALTHRRVDPLGIAAPDLPATLGLSPPDFAPGDKADAAISRLVADPGRILAAYAPVGRQRADVSAAPKASPAARPAVLLPLVPPSTTATVTATVAMPASAPVPPPIDTPGPAPQAPGRQSAWAPPALVHAPIAPATAADPAPLPSPASPVTVGALAAKRDTAPVGAALLTAPAGLTRPPGVETASTPAALGTAPAPSPDLDPAALEAALDASVGAEPVAVVGRPAGLDGARYKERRAIRAFYAGRAFAPLWIDAGAFNAKARSVVGRIDQAAEDGLDLRGVGILPPKDADATAQAMAELSLTTAAVAYGRQASGGRVDPSRLGGIIAAKPDVLDAAQVLGALASAADAGEALRDLNPPHRGYALLRAKLAELRQANEGSARASIPYGPMLKLGMRDERVPLIRARFGLDMVSSDDGTDGFVYDTRTAAAVAEFQKAHHLPASGVLTIRTVAALSGGDPRRIEDEVVANMERWRWLPRDLGQARIEVNIPEYTVRVMHGDSVFHHARVIVGQPDKPTPVFSETMRFIIVNPYWNVPLSIVKKEMLPKLAADPDYFANHGYETVERDGQTYVRQPPGDSNALGRIKFMFPNRYSVYLHDTNSRSLFGNDRRALSHGCVRVDAPFKFAEAVLGRQNGWTEARVKRLVGGDERTINLPRPLPVHIVYFTAFVDDVGALQLRDDVYGYSAKLKAALGLGVVHPGQVAIN